jgi:small subunit ribosomal protein S3
LSDWCAGKRDFAALLIEDRRIRDAVNGSCRGGGLSRVCIQRTRERATVTIHAAEPALFTGAQGVGIERLTGCLQVLCRLPVEVLVEEVVCPQRDAQLVAVSIAEQLRRSRGFRWPVRRAVRLAVESGARGVKVQLRGRLGGSITARTEVVRCGSLPLNTLRARIDHGFAEATTADGCLGVQVWINNGNTCAKA